MVGSVGNGGSIGGGSGKYRRGWTQICSIPVLRNLLSPTLINC